MSIYQWVCANHDTQCQANAWMKSCVKHASMDDHKMSISVGLLKLYCSCAFPSLQALEAVVNTVAILAQGTHRAVAPAQAYFSAGSNPPSHHRILQTPGENQAPEATEAALANEGLLRWQ